MTLLTVMIAGTTLAGNDYAINARTL